MVVIKVGVVRQYGDVVIMANPDIMYAFVRRMRKCPMYMLK